MVVPDREEGEKIVQMRTEKRHRKIFDIFDIKDIRQLE